MKDWMKLLRLASYFGQLGFTLITPPVVMALLGWWLQSRFGLGAWVVAAALLIGLVTAGASAYRFLRKLLDDAGKAQRKERTEKPVVFYKHE